MSFLGQFGSIVFSPHYGSYSSASLHALDFIRIIDNVSFTLLSAGYFYISINIIELCSGIQLCYLEMAWSFVLVS